MAKSTKRDPYRTLGVERDASVQEVRKAYRRKAKRAHPDAGGSADDFAELTRAHDLLIDPVRRLTFDTTGDADDAQPDNKLAGAISIVESMLDKILCEHKNPTAVDIVGVMKGLLDQGRAIARDTLLNAENEIARLTRVVARVRCRTAGDNFIARLLYDRIGAKQRDAARVKLDIEVMTHAAKLLDDYTFDFDKPVRPQEWQHRNVFVTEMRFEI